MAGTRRTRRQWLTLALATLTGWLCSAARWDSITVSADGRSFIESPSGRPFVPWGFNYDHDENGRLLEDYWDDEWPKVVSDFHEMAALGANVVRVHLQLGRFMASEKTPNRAALRRLRRLLGLAHDCGLRLDLTGLGCYHKAAVPAWYDVLPESRRWAVQERFWHAVARTCRNRPEVFCYDLMNEPVVPHRDGTTADWLGPPFAGKHFVQWIAREGRGRDRSDIAAEWTRRLAAVIRAEAPGHLITVGLVPWSLEQPGLDSGFHPSRIRSAVDFLSVHLYPEAGKVDAAMETLRQFAVGQPVLIEETFPLSCPVGEFREFLRRSRATAAGWIGFYWGRTPAECRASGTPADALMLQWLETFERGHP